MISSWHEKRASREEGLPLRFSGKGSGKMDMWNERKADVGLWGGGCSQAEARNGKGDLCAKLGAKKNSSW